MNDNITLPKEVIEQLLKTLKNSAHWSRLYFGSREVGDAIQNLEFALAAEQPKPEPVGVMQESCVMEGLVIPVVTQELPVGTPLYAALVTAETGKEIAALREENERLRTDAERYRWLREESKKRPAVYSGDVEWMVSRVQKGMGNNYFGEKIDAAIDAAMKEAALRREEDQT
jgi:hypothetical protein